MDSKNFKKLVEKAQKGPSFLHDLVYNPEKTVANLKDSIPREQLGRIVANSPLEIVAKAIGVNVACGNTCSSSCGYTCGAGSCGYTTSLHAEVVEKGAAYVSLIKEELQFCGSTCVGNTCGNTCVGGTCGDTAVGAVYAGDTFNNPGFGFQRFR